MKKFKDYIETESFTEEEWGDILFAKELEIRKISEDVSRSDLDQIERYADKLFALLVLMLSLLVIFWIGLMMSETRNQLIRQNLYVFLTHV